MNNKAAVRPRSNGPTPVRVVMADPDESLHSAYQAPLTQEGFEVVPALNALECVARLRERALDVLVLEPLLEPQLACGGGEGVLAVMGEVPQLATVPVVVLTSCRDPHILNRMARFPISDYHLKPLAPNKLAGKLRKLLAHPRRRFTLTQQTGRLESSIAKRTAGRIRNLRVEALEGRVIVRGRSASHHVKQLALAAVQEAFEASESQSVKIELEIEVC